MKYKIGDKIGPKRIELIKITKTTSYGHRYGLFKCPQCGESFEAKIYHVSSGATNFCKKCRVLNKTGQKSVNFKDLTGKRFGKLTVEEYIGSKQVGTTKNNKILSQSFWKCRCDCGNIIERSTNMLTTSHVGSCPNCNLNSQGEYKIKTILEKLGYNYECQKRFKDCKDKQTLPFDFYLPEYNTCIEYDGISHYKPNLSGSWNTEDNVLLTQKHDKIKNEYCRINNIHLIRIPYTNLNKITDTYLKELIINW